MSPDTEKRYIAAYDEYAEAIFRYCFFRVNDRERAKELMQETFVRGWEYILTGKKIDNLRAFLYTVAHNVCVNEAIRPKSFSLDEMRDVTGFDPIDLAAASPEREAEVALLLRKINELEKDDRELLTLRFVNDLPVQEIGAILGQKPNTVSVRLRRATDALREKMNHHE